MKKIRGRARRHFRFTKKVKGSQTKPRLVVFRSRKHIYAQLVDDLSENKVLTSCSTLSKDFTEKKKKANNKEAAKEIGLLIASKAKSLGIERIAFDRAGYKYHGRVKMLADGAREGGLRF